MPTNRDILLRELTNMPLLHGRFTNMTCVNYDPKRPRDKKGCFSLIFKCVDQTTGKNMALKFFDPDRMNELYRIQAFRKEPEILTKLLGKRRCLQLTQGLKPLPINISTPLGPVILPCEYFAIQWIDSDIEDYFQSQNRYDTATKLGIFRDIVLAIQVLHRLGVYHRDIKPDNFRALSEAGVRLVVALDMGTAAQHGTNPSSTPSTDSVGAPGYASPEACCGLARIRTLARYTDIYAIGCMFYELFNIDYFFYALRRDPAYMPTTAALAIELLDCKTDEDKRRAWCSGLTSLKRGVNTPTIMGTGSSVPLSIGSEMNSILRMLVDFDFRARCVDLEKVISRVDGALRIIQNTAWDTRRRIEKKLRREKRLKKQEDRIKLAMGSGKMKGLASC